jgi:hypothetical protein
MMEKDSRKAKVLFLRALKCDQKIFALMMIISTYLISESNFEGEEINLNEFDDLLFLTEAITTNVSYAFYLKYFQSIFIFLKTYLFNTYYYI